MRSVQSADIDFQGWRSHAVIPEEVRALWTQEEAAGNVDSELATVISSIAVACKQIANLVTRAGISNLTGLAGLVTAAKLEAEPPKCTS